MIAETIAGFADYLQENEFNISPDRVGECIVAVGEEGIDCASLDDVVSVMRFYFCTNATERESIRGLLAEYLKGSPVQSTIRKERLETARKQKAETESEFSEKNAGFENALEKLGEESRKIEEDVLSKALQNVQGLSKKEQDFLKKKGRWIRSLKSQVVEQIMAGKYVSPEKIREEEKKLLGEAKKAMMNGNESRMEDTVALFKMLRKMAEKCRKAEEEGKAEAWQATAETRKKMQKLREQQRKEMIAHQKVQEEINREIRRMEAEERSALIQKDKSLRHREKFTGGKNFVQLRGNLEVPKEAEKEFNNLTPAEKQSLTRYIHDNILQFKTRLNRRLNNLDAGNINMLRTIQEACRSGGLPFTLVKNLKRPGKANLVLILDVSGSCKEASAMCLTFIYLLQEVFPRGCQVYAFVNSLYDITDVMKTKDPETAIKNVLSLIPRNGQYSKYDRPIKSLWEEHKNVINKESIIIMMGDARNNKNESAEEEWKNLARRAKRTYWLNTDVREEWDHGDSIASTYARYCPMYEIRTTKQLLTFIADGVK